MKTVTALVFEDFESLDLFGVVEVFAKLPENYRCEFISLKGGLITNSHNVKIQTIAYQDFNLPTNILLIVGGFGTRKLIDDTHYLTVMKELCAKAEFVLSVCTGSALLAKAGLLDNKSATSNKRAWQWVISQSSKVNWKPQARWVVDGKYYTSAGVSAGMDMAFGFIAEQHGVDIARQKARQIEYYWHEDKDNDIFYPDISAQ